MEISYYIECLEILDNVEEADNIPNCLQTDSISLRFMFNMAFDDDYKDIKSFKSIELWNEIRPLLMKSFGEIKIDTNKFQISEGSVIIDAEIEVKRHLVQDIKLLVNNDNESCKKFLDENFMDSTEDMCWLKNSRKIFGEKYQLVEVTVMEQNNITTATFQTKLSMTTKSTTKLTTTSTTNLMTTSTTKMTTTLITKLTKPFTTKMTTNLIMTSATKMSTSLTTNLMTTPATKMSTTLTTTLTTPLTTIVTTKLTTTLTTNFTTEMTRNLITTSTTKISTTLTTTITTPFTTKMTTNLITTLTTEISMKMSTTLETTLTISPTTTPLTRGGQQPSRFKSSSDYPEPSVPGPDKNLDFVWLKFIFYTQIRPD